MLCIHFTFIFLYALPAQYSNKFTFFSQAYAYPFFHQGWSLFAPAPDCNYRLFLSGKGFAGVDLFTALVTRHQANRFAGYGPFVLAFSNSIHYFEKNTPLKDMLNGPVKNDLYFTMIEHEVKNYLLNTKKIGSAANKKSFSWLRM